MENFIVSARKYRPQTFDTVVGQKSITNTLKNAIKNKQLAQAFLFCGPRGIGKTTCARILAKTINCSNLSDSMDACNECESCTSFNRSASFNIHELDAASNNSVDDIRNLVDQVRVPPQIGKYKVYIIDEVHMLSQAAFNAFLKTLEEPPAYAKFILATTEKHKIIPTILSRCQIYDFKRITVEDIANHLTLVAGKEDVTAESDALQIIAQKADGALRDALSIFDQIVSFSGRNITYKNVIENLNVLDYDYYFRIVEYVLKGDIQNTLLIINEIIANGFDGQHFIIGFGEHLRNLLVCKDPGTLKLLETGGSIRSRYQEQAKICPTDFLIKALDLNNKCDIDYKSSNNKTLHIELTLLKICTLKDSVLPVTGYVAKIPSEKAEKPFKPADIALKNELREPQASIGVKKPAGSFPQTTSIKKNPVVTENKASAENLNVKPDSPFTQERLEHVWSEVAVNHKQENNLFATMTKYKPKKTGEHLIEFMVDNKIQEQDLKERAIHLLPIIHSLLNNFHVQLKIVVAEQRMETKPYTGVEKFNKMAEQYPEIKQFKDQLGLDIEY